MTGSSIDNTQFRRILSRNVAMPLGMGVLSALVFVGIIAYLINVLSWVEHSERVIGKANEISRMSSDMEAGMRGYLLSGDAEFLAPYSESKSRIDADLNALARMVDDNYAQLDRVRRVRSAQREWQLYAEEAIAQRTRNVDVVALVKSGRGKMLTDEVRRQFRLFIETEEQLLQQRNSSSRSVIAWSVGAFLLFSLTVAGLLALFGRRELLGLSNSYGEILAHEAEHNALLRHQDRWPRPCSVSSRPTWAAWWPRCTRAATTAP
jgi:CHASE3 domain sensor protein